MTKNENLTQQLQDTKRALWLASQTNDARGVFRMQAELDRLLDERDAK